LHVDLHLDRVHLHDRSFFLLFQMMPWQKLQKKLVPFYNVYSYLKKQDMCLWICWWHLQNERKSIVYKRQWVVTSCKTLSFMLFFQQLNFCIYIFVRDPLLVSSATHFYDYWNGLHSIRLLIMAWDWEIVYWLLYPMRLFSIGYF
jgi:hypothetical protein